jgi:glutaredoxin
MLTLYQAEWCPYCHRVRQVMTELGLTYITVNVPADRDERAEVMALSDQPGIPTLQDGDKIFSDSDEIIEYLRATYPTPPDAEQHAAQGAWRAAGLLSLPPQAALARLKELLEGKGFKIVAQTRGSKISNRLPPDYVLLQVTVPVAAVKVLELDPLAPSAVSFSMAVVPTGDGGSVVTSADPVAQVWLFGEPQLTKIQTAVKERLAELLNEL